MGQYIDPRDKGVEDISITCTFAKASEHLDCSIRYESNDQISDLFLPTMSLQDSLYPGKHSKKLIE